MIKLIATDMDGTFLDSNKRFDFEFIDIFYELKKRDIKFVVASGNQYYRLFQKFVPLSEQMYFIAENGCVIAKGARQLYCNTIENEDLIKIKSVLANYKELVIVLCVVERAYIL
ncbi:MAG: HAD hydrolase family protein [Thomasclavelia sp.]